MKNQQMDFKTIKKQLLNGDILEFDNTREDLIVVWFSARKSNRFCIMLNGTVVKSTKTFPPIKNKLIDLNAQLEGVSDFEETEDETEEETPVTEEETEMITDNEKEILATVFAGCLSEDLQEFFNSSLCHYRQYSELGEDFIFWSNTNKSVKTALSWILSKAEKYFLSEPREKLITEIKSHIRGGWIYASFEDGYLNLTLLTQRGKHILSKKRKEERREREMFSEYKRLLNSGGVLFFSNSLTKKADDSPFEIVVRAMKNTNRFELMCGESIEDTDEVEILTWRKIKKRLTEQC